MNRAADLRAALVGASHALHVHAHRALACRLAGRPTPPHKARAVERARLRYAAARAEAARMVEIVR